MRSVVAPWAIAISSLMLASPTFAQTLRESMTAALDSNPDYAADRARFDAVRTTVPRAFADFLPSITLSGSASISNSRVETPAGVVVTDTRNEPWTGGANASQTLFDGGRTEANLRRAKANVAVAEANLANTTQTLLLDVTRAYANLLEAQDILKARMRSAENIEVQRRFAEAKFEAGVATKTDLAQAEARLAQAQTGVIRARAALAAAVEAFRRLTGAPPNALSQPESLEGLPTTLDDALAFARKNAPSIAAARASVLAAEAGYDVAKSAGRLRITLDANKSYGGGMETGSNESESDSVGLRLSIPLFSGGATYAGTREARFSKSAALYEVSAADDRLRETVTNAFTALEAARSALATATRQLEAAELAYRGITLEQEAGLRANIEVLDQEEQLLFAQLALAGARKDLTIAERGLAAAIGALVP